MSDGQRLSRKLSRHAVMEVILKSGPISRAALSKETALSKQTISEIVGALEAQGFVRQTGRTHGHVGRTAVNYELVPEAAYVAAVDLGGTKIAVAIADLACALVAEGVAPTDPRGGQFVVDQIADLCRKAALGKGIAVERIRLAVIGVPGSPDKATGRVLLVPNIADFDRMDVAAAFEKALGAPVVLENDVNLGAVGEKWIGQGRGVDNLAYVALGTGTGSGLIVGGELLRGFGNAAGEIAFLPFGADPFDPASLGMGAFERLAGSFGMVELFRQRSGETVSVPALFEKAAAGVPAAIEVLDDTGKLLARGIAAIAAIANPEKVVLGGSIGLRTEMLERIRRYLPLCFPYPVTVEPALLGGRAAVIGAAAIGVGQLHGHLFEGNPPSGRLTLPPAGPLLASVPESGE